MKVYTPTSAKHMRGFACVFDFVGVALAGPLSAWLRDPGLFDSRRLGPALQYCSVTWAVGVLMLLVFHPGGGMIDSRREVENRAGDNGVDGGDGGADLSRARRRATNSRARFRRYISWSSPR